MPAARVALFVVMGLLLGTGVTAAQADLAKALVGTRKGEIQQRTRKGADPGVTLTISSVKQEDGKCVADARLGGAEQEKSAKVNIDIDTSGSKPSLRFKGAKGTEYDVSLFNDKELVGTAQLTTGAGGGKGDRSRSVKFEKQ